MEPLPQPGDTSIPVIPEPVGRVQMTPPPLDLADAVRTKAVQIAGELGPQNRGAVVAVATTKGVNLAVMARMSGHWFVQGYIAKEWGQPLEAGGGVQLKW